MYVASPVVANHSYFQLNVMSADDPSPPLRSHQQEANPSCLLLALESCEAAERGIEQRTHSTQQQTADMDSKRKGCK